MTAHETRERHTSYSALQLLRMAGTAVRLMDEVERLADGGRVEDLHLFVTSIADEWDRAKREVA